MHDIIHWLAVHLVETPQTVQKLDQAFRSIEQGNKFECMYALTEPIDNLESQGTALPDQYQEIVDQVCQEAVNLLDNSLKQSKKRSAKKSKKQVGGDPFSVFGWPVLESGLFVGGISFAGIAVLASIYGIVKWYQRRHPGKTRSPIIHVSEPITSITPKGVGFIQRDQIPPGAAMTFDQDVETSQYTKIPAAQYGQLPTGNGVRPSTGGIYYSTLM